MVKNQQQKGNGYARKLFTFVMAICCVFLLETCSLLPFISGPVKIKEIKTSELVHYMLENKIDTAHAFYLSKSAAMAISGSSVSLPTIQIFDSTGQLYSIYRDSSSCIGTSDNFFSEEYDMANLTPVESNRLSASLNSGLIDLEDNNFNYFNSFLSRSEYTVVIYWATFAIHNKRIKDWHKVIDRKPEFQVITVSLDPNTTWKEDV